MAYIVVLEDDPACRVLMTRWLSAAHYHPLPADDGPVGIELASAQHADGIVADIRLPTISGFEVASRCRTMDGGIGVVFVTGFPTAEYIKTAELFGAALLRKPFNATDLVAAVEASLRQRYSAATAATDTEGDDYQGMIGRSHGMQSLYRQIEVAAAQAEPVLVCGETGAGKELVARAIHRRSRVDQPFIDLNCSALPDTLVESELFGHERGAFTDARESRAGLIEQASGGTLFLDEVGDLSTTAQPKLLRVVERHEVSRLGGGQKRVVNVHIVAATNVNIRAAVSDGRFRADLFWRLNGLSIFVPPVRDRGPDIGRLIDHFMRLAVDGSGKPRTRLTSQARSLLLAYDWPGNIREMKQVLRHAVLASEGDVGPGDLNLAPGTDGTTRSVGGLAASPSRTTASLREVRIAGDAMAIRQALAKHQGNRTRAAAALGIDRTTLIRRLAKLS